MHSPSGKGSLLQYKYMVWTRLRGSGRCYSTGTWCGHSPSGKGSLLQHRYTMWTYLHGSCTAQVHGVWTLTFREGVVATAHVHGVDTHLQESGSCYSIATLCGHTFR